MGDLLDELQGASSARIGENVRALGGDVLDELGVVTKTPELLSPRLTEQRATESRQKILDEMNAELSTVDRFLVGAGRGLTNVARGVGLAEQEDPATRQAFKGLAEESIVAQAGEIVGEASPFLLAAPLAGPGLATSVGGRVLIPAATRALPKVAAAGTLGALEGGILTRGRGGSNVEAVGGTVAGGVLAGTIETMLPVLGRMGRAVFDKLGRKPKGPLLTPDGAPTRELQAALEETGTTFEDLTSRAFATVNKPGVDPAQAVRAARFKSQGIPSTAGDITQDFGQQTAEQRILSQAGTAAGDPLRQVKLQQSEAFKAKVSELVDTLGVPEDTGDSLKAALTSRKRTLKAQKNKLYEEVAATPGINDIPFITDEIAKALPSPQELRRLSRIAGGQVAATRDLMVEFGVDQTEDAVEAFTKAGGEITPLSLGNFEEFRQAIGQIERADITGAAQVATGPIKAALDAEADLIADRVQAAGLAGGPVIAKLKKARALVRREKTEFSPKAITGRLIDVARKDGVTPIIEASKAAEAVLRPSAPIEHLQRTLSSLHKAGPKGRKAIGNMQASVIMNALEDALKAPSRKTGGIETIGGNQFAKSLSKFGEDKLAMLFRGKERQLQRLANLKQTALDIEPTAGAVPKGSASVVLDIVKGAGNIPGLAAVKQVAEFVIKAGADERAVTRMLKAQPALRKTIGAINADFPALASALGVAAIVPTVEGEK